MKYILVLLVFLLATPCFAVFTRTYIVAESGGDHATLAAAEAAHEQDLEANDSALTFEITGTWASPEPSFVQITGWTMTATQNLTVTATGDARAGTLFSTTAYRIAGALSTPYLVAESYVVTDGIQIRTTSSSSNVVSVSSTGDSIILVMNCWLGGDGVATTVRGILANAGAATFNHRYRNNIIIDCGAQGILYNSGNATECFVDNNTFFDCATGLTSNPTNGSVARNNIFWGTTTALSGSYSDATKSQENWTDLSSINYTGCTGCGTGDQLSQSDPFEDEAGEDLALASGATAIDAGLDLSGDFTDAIGGKTRDANFDKGADEFIAAVEGNRVLIRIGMIFWRYGIMI